MPYRVQSPFELYQGAAKLIPDSPPEAHPLVDAYIKRLISGEMTAEQAYEGIRRDLAGPPPQALGVNAVPGGANVTSAPMLNDEAVSQAAPAVSPNLEAVFQAGDPTRSTPRALGTVPQPPAAGPQNAAPGFVRPALNQLVGSTTASLPPPGPPPARPTLAAPPPAPARIGAPVPSAAGAQAQRGLGATGPFPGSDRPFTQAQADAILPHLRAMEVTRQQAAARRELEDFKAQNRMELQREAIASRERVAELGANTKYASLLEGHNQFVSRFGLDQQKVANDAAEALLRHSRELEAIAQRAALKEGDWKLDLVKLKANIQASLERARIMAGATITALAGSPLLTNLLNETAERIAALEAQAAAGEADIRRDRDPKSPTPEVKTPLPAASTQQPTRGAAPAPKKKAAPAAQAQPPAGGGETKTVGGKTYRRTPSGWVLVK